MLSEEKLKGRAKMKQPNERETGVIVNGTPDITKIPEEIFVLFIAELTEAIISQKKMSRIMKCQAIELYKKSRKGRKTTGGR